MTGFRERCRALVVELGLGEMGAVRPLTGGVASDIAAVEVGGREICVKFALPKLKVAANWQAPVHRNAAEYAWLEVAAGLFPDSAVQLLGRSARLHGFAMEFIAGPGVYLWKARLLDGTGDAGEAAAVGRLLGAIHQVSSAPGFERGPFKNREDFRALRIEPYLSHLRPTYPELAAPIEALEALLFESDQVLVHGDASPKNILFRDGAPILLDAECATMGDASFDPAFCLNHLILKAIHLPSSRDQLFAEALALWRAYADEIRFEPPSAIEKRVCQLLPALMLARVDGKSPVEYLSAAAQVAVRRMTPPMIMEPPDGLDALVTEINTALKESGI